MVPAITSLNQLFDINQHEAELYQVNLITALPVTIFDVCNTSTCFLVRLKRDLYIVLLLKALDRGLF